MVEQWVIIGIFVATQLISLGGVIIAIRIDSNIMKSQMIDVREELKKLTQVLVVQAEHHLQIDNISERLTLTGKRVDEQGRRLNKFVDAIALSVNARAMLMEADNDDGE